VDVILAFGTLAPLAAKRASATIPIVMANAGDPLGSGLVVSLAQPGGNVTGMSLMAPDLGGKRLELLKELLPRLSRVAVIWNAANPYSALVFEETRGAAKTLAIELQSLEVRGPDDFGVVLDSAGRKRADALVTVEDPLTFNHRKQIAEFCARNRLPAMYGLRAFTGLEPVVTWQNMGQTIALADIGTASDLACGLDCLFTIGAASFHVNSITFFGGDLVGSSFIEGIGTIITPEFEATDRFSLIVRNHRDPDLSQFKFVPEADVSFSFTHSVPAPLLGPGLPGVLALLGWFGWRRRRSGIPSARLS
jgi:hypothetical protein